MDITSHTAHSIRNLIYSREELLELRTLGHAGHAGTFHLIPEELRRQYRGCRAGAEVKARLMEKRWRFKPSIPSCVKGNVNSLANKTDELAAPVKNVSYSHTESAAYYVSRRHGSQATSRTLTWRYPAFQL